MTTYDLDRIRFVTRHFNDLQGLRTKIPAGLLALSIAGALYPVPPGTLLAGLLLALSFGLATEMRTYYQTRFGEVETQPAAAQALSIFSPATGPASFAEIRPVSPYAQLILSTMAPAFVAFMILQAASPAVEVGNYDPPGTYAITVDSVFEAGSAWTRGIHRITEGGMPMQLSLDFTQLVLLLFGAYFLAVWLWRERHRSQEFYLATGALLLGLAALGSCLGYFAYAENERLVWILNAALPVLVRPWVAMLFCGILLTLAGLRDHRQLVRVMGPVTPREEDPS